MALADRKCEACTSETPRLTGAEVASLIGQLEDWQIDDRGHLAKTYKVMDFITAVEVVNKVTPIADEEGHHPDLHVAWGRVGVELWTHAIDGLSEADFVMAAKIDRALTGAD